MKPDEIRAIALEVAKEVNGVHDPRLAEGFIAFGTRFLAAITEKEDPFMWWDGEAVVDNAFVAEHKLQKYDFMVPLYRHPSAAEPAQNLYREIYEVWAGSDGVPMPQTCVESYLLGLIEQMRDLAKEGMRSTHPAIEPAPQQHVCGLQGFGHPDDVCNACQSKRAAPLPDEVAQMVERLRDEMQYLPMGASRYLQAADMIERLARERDMWRETDLRDAARVDELAEKLGRLARQVPPDCVVVDEQKANALFGEYTWSQYKPLIAAGEVKP